MITATVHDKANEETDITVSYTTVPEVHVNEDGAEIAWHDQQNEYFVQIPTESLLAILDVQIKGLLELARTE